MEIKGKKHKGKLMRVKVGKELINQATNNKKINIHKAMLKAGYAKSTADKRVAVIRRSPEVQQELGNFINDLNQIVNNSIRNAKSKQDKASFRDNIEAIDKMKKLEQLITGNPTSNEKMTVGWEE